MRVRAFLHLMKELLMSHDGGGYQSQNRAIAQFWNWWHHQTSVMTRIDIFSFGEFSSDDVTKRHNLPVFRHDFPMFEIHPEDTRTLFRPGRSADESRDNGTYSFLVSAFHWHSHVHSLPLARASVVAKLLFADRCVFRSNRRSSWRRCWCDDIFVDCGLAEKFTSVEIWFITVSNVSKKLVRCVNNYLEPILSLTVEHLCKFRSWPLWLFEYQSRLQSKNSAFAAKFCFCYKKWV